MKHFRIVCDDRVISEHDDLLQACIELETIYREHKMLNARLMVIDVPAKAKSDKRRQTAPKNALD